METYRYREGEPEPEGWPQPSQSRADFIKAKAHGADADDVPAQMAPQNKDVPYVGGTAAVGSTLNCTMGNWTGEPTGYAYAWQSGGAAVGTDAPDYVVAATDAGKQIVCVVTATNAHGSTAAPPSNAVSIP
jgi:hypothetical protein